MQWNIALILEAALLTILWRKKSPRWFSILIGVDFIASLLQLIPYRAGLRGFPVLIWEAGIVLALPLQFLALRENTLNIEAPMKKVWHRRILCAWLCMRLCILSLQTQRELLIPLNMPLLAVDAAAYVAWIALFLL